MMFLTTSESQPSGDRLGRTRAEIDLHAVFASTTAYRSTTTGGEHALFVGAGITPVHSWLVGPERPEYAAIKRMEDYESAMNLIVEADVLRSSLSFGTGNAEDGDGAVTTKAHPRRDNDYIDDPEEFDLDQDITWNSRGGRRPRRPQFSKYKSYLV